MIVLEIEQIEIDHCLTCGAVWLDGGELELLLDGANEKDTLLSSLENIVDSQEKKVRCPRCNKKMNKVVIGTDKKVTIDKCPENDGLWFDKGELHEIHMMSDIPKDQRIAVLLNEIFGEKDEPADS